MKINYFELSEGIHQMKCTKIEFLHWPESQDREKYMYWSEFAYFQYFKQRSETVIKRNWWCYWDQL